MNPADIQAAIKKAGTTQKAIAKAEKVSEVMVSRVIRDESRSLRIARRISRVVRTPVNTLWPGAYPRTRVQVIT